MEDENRLLWLQGVYTYNALLCASPAFLSLRKPGTKPIPYLEKPLDVISRGEEESTPSQSEVERERAKAIVFFTNWANAQKKKAR